MFIHQNKVQILVKIVTSFGIKAIIELTTNINEVSSPTNYVFTFGDPLIRLFKQSIINCRPGTNNVNRDKSHMETRGMNCMDS